MKFYYETLLEEEWKAKYILEEKDSIMLSDIVSSAKYLEVKRAADDWEEWIGELLIEQKCWKPAIYDEMICLDQAYVSWCTLVMNKLLLSLQCDLLFVSWDVKP